MDGVLFQLGRHFHPVIQVRCCLSITVPLVEGTGSSYTLAGKEDYLRAERMRVGIAFCLFGCEVRKRKQVR